MPELLINYNIENILFTFFSLGILIFSFLSVNSNNSLNSIISFLIAIIHLIGCISLSTDSVFSITASTVYISMCLLLLLISKITKNSKSNRKSRFLWIIFFINTVIISIISYRFDLFFIKRKATEFYCGTIGITLMISFLFILVISGISFLLSNEKNNN